MSPRGVYVAVRDWVDRDIATYSTRWPSLTIVILPAMLIYVFAPSVIVQIVAIVIGIGWSAFFFWRLFRADKVGPR